MEILFQVISWTATVVGLFKFLPQTIRTLVKKSVEGLSKQTFIIYLIGSSLWVMYTSLVGVGSGKSFILGTFPSFIVNLIIAMLLIPVIWLMFDENTEPLMIKGKKVPMPLGKKTVPLLLGAFAITAASIGIGFYVAGINVGGVAKLIIVILAGTFTGLGFLPQVIKTFKDKGAKEFSLSATWLGAITDTLWTIFWIRKIMNNLDQPTIVIVTYILATIFTAILTVLLFMLTFIVPYFNKKAGFNSESESKILLAKIKSKKSNSQNSELEEVQEPTIENKEKTDSTKK